MMNEPKYTDQLGILLVDDEEFNLKALKRLLYNQGFSVFTATNGRDALDIMNSHDVAIVVSDMRMPHMSGAELLSKIWEGWPDTQRIVLTGYVDMGEAIDVVNNSNIFRYITKPWDDEYFLHTIHEAAALYWGRELDKFYEKDATEKNQELRSVNERLQNNIAQSESQLLMLNEKLNHSYEDEKLLRRERREAQRISEAKSRFLATMSHEIRTPLNAIIATNTLILETPLSQDQTELAKLSLNGANSLLTLVNDILDSSKINAGRLVLNEVWFQLLEVVETTCDLLAGNLVDKPVDIVIVVEPGTPGEVYGDKIRLGQILTNLISNSVKFTNTGCITVSLSYTQDLQITVSDTGIGIPQEDLPTIFDEFTQVDNSSTQVAGGTGLGLSISKKLCQLMGGDISVGSIVDEGTVFNLSFPFQCSSFIGFPRYLSTRKRILLRTLNASLHKALAVQLNFFGCDLIIENDFNSQSEGEYDAVLYDMDSLCFVSRLAFHQKESVLQVALIGHDGVSRSAKLKSHGFDSVLRKPIRISSLCKYLIYSMADKPSEDHLCSDQKRQVKQWLEEPILKPLSVNPESLDGASILLAEDSPSNQAVIKSILHGMDVHVDIASDGVEACAMASRKTYDVILMDMRMPEKDGLTASKEILQRTGFNQATPIIALTANAYAEDQKACLEAGMSDFISKPINVDQFRSVVSTWCSKSRFSETTQPLSLQEVSSLSSKGPEGEQLSMRLVDEPASKKDFINVETLQQLEKDTSSNVLPKILSIFVEETSSRLDSMLKHTQQCEWSALSNDAHTLKSSAGSFGAFALQDLAKSIEDALRLEGQPNIENLIVQLQAVCKSTLSEMDRVIVEKVESLCK